MATIHISRDSQWQRLLLGGLILLLPMLSVAKMYEPPRSFLLTDKSQDQIEKKVLPKLDKQRLLAEDLEQSKIRSTPHRFAIASDTLYTLSNSGTLQTVSDGQVWRLSIQSPGAESMNLGITRFEMPEGAKLWIYNPSHTDVDGPYTVRNRSHLGSLWTPIIQGDTILVEVFIPTGVAQPQIEIGKVNQGYRGFAKSIPGAGTEGTCENDVICPVGDPWRNQIRAVGGYTVNGTADCSGTMLNDVPVDFTPYFLSAHHCNVDSTSDATVVVYWNYQSPTCGTHGPGSTADNQTGSIFRATNAPSDFLLLELSAKPDPAFNVYYAGWDASGVAPPGDVGIHQPALDVKAISFSNTPPQGADWTGTGDGGTLDPAGNHWRVDWNSGVTERGSSGSCIFETNTGRCIGQLHGGPSACGASAANLHDYYGKFAVSWNGGGTSSTRLKDWLDPGSTGTLSLQGDPHITTANGVHYDFQGAGEYVALRDPDGLEIQTRQSPVPTSGLPGASAYDGLASCVSINTAVAARVGKSRVTFEPSLNGVPDPTGLKLRIDGVVTTLSSSGRNLGNGGRVMNGATPGGLEIDFPDTTVLYVTPTWWAGQGKWYLNVDIFHAPIGDGASSAGSVDASRVSSTGRFVGQGGLAAAIAPGSWLPALPNGASVGPMPATLPERYNELYQKFGQAWRVTAKDSLFDYAQGTSTTSFTVADWPRESAPCTLPDTKPVEPTTQAEAERACKAITNESAHANCLFDVAATGHLGFAKTYAVSQRIVEGATTVLLSDEKNPTEYGKPAYFAVTASRRTLTGRGAPEGSVQLVADGHKMGEPVSLNEEGHAILTTDRLKPGKNEIYAIFVPRRDSAFLASSSSAHIHIVRGDHDQ